MIRVTGADLLTESDIACHLVEKCNIHAQRHSSQCITKLLVWICRDLFQEQLNKLPNTVKCRFALPGIERQDSVYSGLQEIRSEAALVAVHDSARPLLDPADAAACMADAQQVSRAPLSCVYLHGTGPRGSSASMQTLFHTDEWNSSPHGWNGTSQAFGTMLLAAGRLLHHQDMHSMGMTVALPCRWAHVLSGQIFLFLRVLLAGGCSCAGCTCEANHQGGRLKWHGHQDTSEGKFVGGSNASGQLDLAICMQSWPAEASCIYKAC